MLRVFSEPTTAKGILFWELVLAGMGECLDLGIESTLFVIEFVVVVGIHFDIVEGNFGFNLHIRGNEQYYSHTLCLKAWRSASVRESDLAMTGTTLTTSDSFFRTTMSMGFRLKILLDVSRHGIYTRVQRAEWRIDSSGYGCLGYIGHAERWALSSGTQNAGPWYTWQSGPSYSSAGMRAIREYHLSLLIWSP